MVKNVEVCNFFLNYGMYSNLIKQIFKFLFKLHLEREGMLEKDKDNGKGDQDFERVFAN